MLERILEQRPGFQSRWVTRPTVIVAAHSDDEIIGLGILLPQLRRLKAVIHVTDSAPRSGPDFRNAGCRDWLDYASMRRNELERALATAGITMPKRICFWCPDQQASLRIARNAIRLAGLFQRLRPATVFTHSYEGGHPDHDACAAAVQGAVSLLLKEKTPAPTILEFASYHLNGSGMEAECFLAEPACPAFSRPLSDEARERKRRMFDCFESQQHVLANFPCRNEPVRVAPKYNFARPPHQGKLFYEQFSWGVNGKQWRRLARGALTKLGIDSQP
jgi:LmbE family N-acetylglucosaminyl deacetylase